MTTKKTTPAAIQDRPLPHDLDAERAVLGGILVDNAQFYEAAKRVRPTDFFRHAHALVYRAVETLLNAPGGAADFITLRAELLKAGQLDEAGGAAYLTALTDGVPRHANVPHYADIVKAKSLLRGAIRLGDSLVAQGYAQEDSVDEVLARADHEIIRLRHGTGNGRMFSLTESRPGFIEDFEYRIAHRGELWGVPTGFASVDELTGGWQRGDMIVIAARPSIGKTTFVLNAALAAAETPRADGTARRVALFSMEMRRRQLEYRLLSSLSNVSLSRLTSGYVGEEAEAWPAIVAALERLNRASLHIDDTAGRTVWDVRAECRRLQASGGLDLVVVDYVQLMSSTLERRGASRNDEITDISRRLKTMADELACPVIVVSQLNRAGEVRVDPRPRLTDLRESGALEQDADLVCFLHRKHHREGGSTEFVIEKQRNGPTGTVYLTMYREVTRFEDGGEPPPPPTPAEEREGERRTRRTLFGRRG